VSARAGGDPTRGGSGHVERVIGQLAAGVPTVETIGGNEQNRWILAPYDLTDPSIRGCIEVDPRIGERAVEVAIAEMRAGVAEVPGSRHHERIQAYHAGARRGGSPLAGMPGYESGGVAVLGPKAADEVAWCASGASWTAYEAVMQLTAG
jgi:hypothetical protein